MFILAHLYTTYQGWGFLYVSVLPSCSLRCIYPFQYISFMGHGHAISHRTELFWVKSDQVIPRPYFLIPQAPFLICSSYIALWGPPAQWKRLQLGVWRAPPALTQEEGHSLLEDAPDRAGEGGAALSLVAVPSCTMGTRDHLKPGWGLVE